MKHTIIDNFLPAQSLYNIQDILGIVGEQTTDRLPLYYTRNSLSINLATVAVEAELNAKFNLKGTSGNLGGHFGHVFFDKFDTASPYHEGIVLPILDTLGCVSLIRAKLNINIQEGADATHTGWHIDYIDSPKYYTALLYLTTNEGTGTLLEDGTFIDFVENRLVYFPGNTYHSGILGERFSGVRVAINLNFTM